MKICQKFLEIDKRVKLINQRNRGLSAARNAGINISIGKYIGFVDSDDWINPNMYKILIELIEKEKVDISICDFIQTRERKEIIDFNSKYEYKVFNKKDAFKEFLKLNIQTFAWNKVYKRELFYEINFPEGRLYEDEFIMYKLFDMSNKIAISDYKGYNYFWRTNSIMNREFSREQFDLFEAVTEVINYTKSNYPDLIGLAYYKFIYVNMLFYNRLFILNNYKSEMNFIRNNIKKTIFKVPFFDLNLLGKKIWISALLVYLRLYRNTIDNTID